MSVIKASSASSAILPCDRRTHRLSDFASGDESFNGADHEREALVIEPDLLCGGHDLGDWGCWSDGRSSDEARRDHNGRCLLLLDGRRWCRLCCARVSACMPPYLTPAGAINKPHQGWEQRQRQRRPAQPQPWCRAAQTWAAA